MVQHRAILTMAINRKSYIIYRTAPFSMILNDPYPQFQDNAIIFWCWVSQKRYGIQT